MTTYRFTVPGEPVAKARPRAAMVGGKARIYTPQKTVRFEERVLLHAKQAGVKKIDGPIQVRIVAWWEWPKAKWRKREPRLAAWRWNGPDADNIAKACLDGVQPLMGDDRQVAVLHIQKMYAVQGEPARTAIEIRALETKGAPDADS